MKREHYWWPGGEDTPRPLHFTELPIAYSSKLVASWLYVEEGHLVLRCHTRGSISERIESGFTSKLVERIRVEPVLPQLSFFHPDDSSPSIIIVDGTKQLAPVLKALARIHTVVTQATHPESGSLVLEAPLQLCEARAGRSSPLSFRGSPLWRLWTELSPTGQVVLLGTGNGWGGPGAEWGGPGAERRTISPVATVDFEDCGPTLLLRGVELTVDTHGATPTDAMIKLALPRDHETVKQLLQVVHQMAVTANVAAPAPSLLANLEPRSLGLSAVSLAALRAGDASAVEMLSSGLYRRGFCFVDVDDALGALSDSAVCEAEAFLAVSSENARTDRESSQQVCVEGQEGVAEMDQLSQLQLVGHFEDKWKGGIRLLTGELLDEPSQQQGLPAALTTALMAVSRELDAAAIDVLRSCMPLFAHQFNEAHGRRAAGPQTLNVSAGSEADANLNMSAEALCTELGVALLYEQEAERRSKEVEDSDEEDFDVLVEWINSKRDPKEPQNKLKRQRKDEEKKEATDKHDNASITMSPHEHKAQLERVRAKEENLKCFPRYGIVDCVRYSMDEGCPELVVGAHVDPGLFVLAPPQRGQGLQLCDEHGSWVEVPEHKGVIWAGAAATGRFVRGGQHRVVCAPSKPRIALWHELCTYGQLVPPVLKLLHESGLELRLGDTRGTVAVLRELRAAEDHKELDEGACDSPRRRGGVKGSLTPRSAKARWSSKAFHQPKQAVMVGRD